MLSHCFSLAVCKFCTENEERCEEGYGWVCGNFAMGRCGA